MISKLMRQLSLLVGIFGSLVCILFLVSFSFTWPIIKIGLPTIGITFSIIFGLLIVINYFLRQKNGELGYKNIINHVDTRFGAALALIFIPLFFTLMAGVFGSTLDHWKLKLFANEPVLLNAKVVRLDDHKPDWFTWTTRFQNLDNGAFFSVRLSRNMINHTDIGKCVTLSGRKNNYGNYIENKTYRNCE